MGMRATLYLRVSTARQAEKDLSIPDQHRQAEAYCKANDWIVVAAYVEPGASATDDRRPAFQRMIEAACSPERPFDTILVHSFSRFFRDAFQFELHRRRLRKNKVGLVSITQNTGEDAAGDMQRQILTLFDEYQSKENAKHVLRAMKENARQGFWNGGPPPYGYRCRTVETRADAVKKVLEIDPGEAGIVKEIFDLFGGQRGRRMGIRAIAAHLNGKGLRYRKGRPFTSGLVHQVLTRRAYAGTHYFNQTEAKTKQRKDRSEWIEFQTPAVIDPARFEQTQRELERRRPANTPRERAPAKGG